MPVVVGHAATKNTHTQHVYLATSQRARRLNNPLLQVTLEIGRCQRGGGGAHCALNPNTHTHTHTNEYKHAHTYTQHNIWAADDGFKDGAATRAVSH